MGKFDLAGAAVILRDRCLHAGFGDDYRLDIETGHELYVVHREDVRRIDHGEREGGAYA